MRTPRRSSTSPTCDPAARPPARAAAPTSEPAAVPAAPDGPGDRSRSAIDRLVDQARARIAPRVAVETLDDAVSGGALVVDTRPEDLRRRDGALPGAVVVERNVLEWRLDPTCPHRLAGMDDADRRVIIVCDEGYASSLAAAALLDLGLTNVTDLDGGFQAWSARFR